MKNVFKFFYAVFFLISLFFFVCLLRNSAVFAQNLTSTSSFSNEIEQIKDKIASKVAEISNNELIAFSGKVLKFNTQDKTFEISNGEKVYTVGYLQNTQYFWLRKDNGQLSLNFSNIEVDDYLFVIGSLIKAENRINANFIYGKNFSKVITASIVENNGKNILIKSVSSNTDYTVNLDSGISIFQIKKDTSSKISLSDLKEKNLITVYGTINNKDNSISASRILLIQN